MEAGLWKGASASTNHHEYSAEGVQSWFDNNRHEEHEHLRAQFVEYDPRLAAMCRVISGDTEIGCTKPTTRLLAHMAGSDLASGPTFAWPDRLLEAKRQIREVARTRAESAHAPASARSRVP